MVLYNVHLHEPISLPPHTLFNRTSQPYEARGTLIRRPAVSVTCFDYVTVRHSIIS